MPYQRAYKSQIKEHSNHTKEQFKFPIKEDLKVNNDWSTSERSSRQQVQTHNFSACYNSDKPV